MAVNCPSCTTRLKVGARHVGKLVDCPKCRCLFVFQGAEEDENGPPDMPSVEQAGLRSVDWSPSEVDDLPPAAAKPSQSSSSLQSSWVTPSRKPNATPAPTALPVAALAPTSIETPPRMPTPTWAEQPAASPVTVRVPPSTVAPSSATPLPPSATPGPMAPPMAAPAPANTSSTQVPRFKAADPTKSSVQLVVDGKLPELNLLETKKPAKATAEEKKARPALMYGALAVSVLMSLSLAVFDFDTPSANSGVDAAWAQNIIKDHCKQDGKEPLSSYQLLLRDAQQARLRGDRQTEVARYRNVLELLRMEGRKRSLTPSQEKDKQLEEAISVELQRGWY